MQVKCLEIRDHHNTFIPVICIRPVPDNEEQRYLLRRDGYRGNEQEDRIILIDAKCRNVARDPYDWPASPRTHRVAHLHIKDHWHMLKDGEVIDVAFLLNETDEKKVTERITAARSKSLATE